MSNKTMKIKGSDIKEGTRNRLLISTDALLFIQEMETECEPPLRRFRLREQASGLDVSAIYSDQLNPGVLERFGSP